MVFDKWILRCIPFLETGGIKMCAAPSSIADILILGSLGILAVVLLIEACAFLYKHQFNLAQFAVHVWTLPDKLHQRLFRH